MFQDFTDPARKAVDVAREAAGAARRAECGVDCLLLGLAASPDSGGGAVLDGLGLDEGRIRGALGAAADAVARDVSFSPAALRAIEGAKGVAHRLGHECVDTMHLLIGILECGDEAAMRSVGLDPGETRARVAEVFGFTLPSTRMHPDLRDWVIERVQAEAAQLHARIDARLIDRAIGMGGPPAGAADEPARRLVRRAIALRHGGTVLEVERSLDGLSGEPRWAALRRQAEALPPPFIELTGEDLDRAARDLVDGRSASN